MNKFLITTHLINGLLLIRFAISKLFAWPISVKAFIEMAGPIGIDPTFFRIFTGIVITLVCLGYLTNFSLLLIKKVNKHFMIFCNLAGTGVMLGALGAEFFLRLQPKWPLVLIAVLIVITSITNIIKTSKPANKN